MRCGFNFCLALVELNHTKNYEAIPKESIRTPYAEPEVSDIITYQNEDMDENKAIISGYPFKYAENKNEVENEKRK